MRTLRQEVMHKLEIITGHEDEDFTVEADAILHVVSMATGTPAAELAALPVQS